MENTESLKGSGIDAELTQTLERAAPVYKARWWPEHNRKNLAWITAVTPLVAKYEGVMKKELSAAYQTPWPSGQIRTDRRRVRQLGRSLHGAGSHAHHDLKLARSGLRRRWRALFHEASHAMIQKVSDALAAELDVAKEAFSAARVLARRALLHSRRNCRAASG